MTARKRPSSRFVGVRLCRLAYASAPLSVLAWSWEALRRGLARAYFGLSACGL
ncbi:MAG: hypothetical protein RR338_03010 [Clostridia bacterium]